MPRTTTLECPGCPPLRAITFDSLGLIKVIEARDKPTSVPKVVDRWGIPDSSKCVLAASIDDRKSDPLLAVARKCGAVEVFNPINGDLRAAYSTISDGDLQPEDDPIAGLHLFKKPNSETEARSCTLLTCTTKGNASLRSINVANAHAESSSIGSPTTWKVCGAGNILFSEVNGNENCALFGGKGVEVNIWDLEKCAKTWTAKFPPKNNLGIFTPTWFTSATFLSNDDHRKFVAGTNNHQVRLYDISAQRRPVISFDFRETAIKAVAGGMDGHTVYVGNGSGDLASFDMRTGKLLGSFLGKCSGSIRSIARHPSLPVIASCGLDSYVRFWDIKTRQLLSAVFLKQHLTNVVFDSSFEDKEVVETYANPLVHEVQAVNDNQSEEEVEPLALPVKRKKSKEKDGSKKKASKDKDGNKRLKSKKKSKQVAKDRSSEDDS